MCDVTVALNKKKDRIGKEPPESESRIFDGVHLRTVCFFLYAIKCMLIFGGRLPMGYPFHEI